MLREVILTSTASLSNDLRYEDIKRFFEMVNEEKEKKNKRIYGHFPMFLLPAIMGLAFKKHLKDSPETYKAIKELMNKINR